MYKLYEGVIVVAPDDEILIKRPGMWMTLLFLLAFIVFFVDVRLSGYAFLLVLYASVIWGVKRKKFKSFAVEAVKVIFVPQIIVVLLLIFNKQVSTQIEWLSMFFDRYLSFVLLGVSDMGERLMSDGYAERAMKLKGFAVVVFFMCALFARDYLVTMHSVGDTYKIFKTVPNKNEGWLGRNFGAVMLVTVAACMTVFVDWYNPGCKRRCMGVEISDVPIFNFYTGIFSMTYFFIGLWINGSRMRDVRLKYSIKEDKNEH